MTIAALELRNIEFAWPNQAKSLFVIPELSLQQGQTLFIGGPSGSGKSSLAFDTLYAEGQRRYVESLSAYARQFLQMMQKRLTYKEL